MPGQGMQNIPFRIPATWDAAWYERHIREVLALADTRNAIEGAGITISGQPGEQATISTTEDLQNLLLQTFVLATPSGFLQFERVLTGGDAIEIIDGGANSTITVGVEDSSINLGKLLPLSGAGILGNPVDAVGEIQNINPEAALSVVHYDGTNILFDLIDHTYVSDFDEAAQDAVGTILTDSTSIDFTYNDGSNTINAALVDEYAQDLVGAMLANTTSVTLAYNDGAGTFNATVSDEYVQDVVGAMLADSTSIDFTYNDGAGTFTASTINANPSGLIGMTAVNGTAATPLRSDGRHAIDPAIAPTWTQPHIFQSSTPISLRRAGDGPFIEWAKTDGTQIGYFQAITATAFFLAVTEDIPIQFLGQSTRKHMELGKLASTFGNTTDNPTHEFLGTGTVTGGGLIKAQTLAVFDGVTAPGTVTSYAVIYVDTADGDLKIKFADGTVKLIVTD